MASSRKRPRGPNRRVTKRWLGWVRAAMDERGWDQRDLAKELKVNEGTVSRLFKMKYERTRLYDLICGLLNVPPDIEAIIDGNPLAERFVESFQIVMDTERIGGGEALSDLERRLRGFRDAEKAKAESLPAAPENEKT